MKKPSLRSRILDSLRYSDQLGLSLCDELVVDRRTLADTLGQMVKDGVLFRRFHHNKRKGWPDYLYSTSRLFRVSERRPPPDLLRNMLGDYDAIDFRRLNQ